MSRGRLLYLADKGLSLVLEIFNRIDGGRVCLVHLQVLADRFPIRPPKVE